jgi:hypothetical protein
MDLKDLIERVKYSNLSQTDQAAIVRVIDIESAIYQEVDRLKILNANQEKTIKEYQQSIDELLRVKNTLSVHHEVAMQKVDSLYNDLRLSNEKVDLLRDILIKRP